MNVVKEVKEFTYDVVKDCLPRNQRSMVTPEFIDKLNKINKDPELLGSFIDNFLGYIDVLKSGKFRMDAYINAVRYISYKLLGKNDIDAYAAVFPDRYQKLKDKGLTRAEIGNYVHAYKKSELVTRITEQTLVPDYILNAPLREKAFKSLANIMLNAKSEIARVQAANAILANTKPPEVTKVQLDIGLKESDAIAELREVTQQLAKQQKLAIESGAVTTKEIAHSKIIDVQVEQVEDE